MIVFGVLWFLVGAVVGVWAAAAYFALAYKKDRLTGNNVDDIIVSADAVFGPYRTAGEVVNTMANPASEGDSFVDALAKIADGNGRVESVGTYSTRGIPGKSNVNASMTVQNGEVMIFCDDSKVYTATFPVNILLGKWKARKMVDV